MYNGEFLTGLRNNGVCSLVTVEPVPLESCLFAGKVQDSTDWINTHLSQLPSKKFDLVMTIEAAEHIPVGFHQHHIQALVWDICLTRGKRRIDLAIIDFTNKVS